MTPLRSGMRAAELGRYAPMKLLAKVLAALLIAAVAIPLAGLLAYDALSFQPHREEIRAILAAADPEDRSPPDLIQELILAQGGPGPSVSVARSLLTQFVPERSGSMLGWHGRFFLWDLMVRMHLSHTERLGLYCSLAYNSEGNGLNNLAQRMYGKPLSLLSPSEAATVVAYLHAPGMYARNPERLAQRRDLLLSRLGA